MSIRLIAFDLDGTLLNTIEDFRMRRIAASIWCPPQAEFTTACRMW